MARPADLLSLFRLGLALAFPFVLVRGGGMPAVLWAAGAASDYLDGPLARRTGTVSSHGMLLDNAADIAFVLGGLATAAALGLVPWLVPAAIALAVVDYARASLDARRGRVSVAVARSRIGHAAGVLNYACLGMVCARVAWANATSPLVLAAVELATVATNLAAVMGRIVGRASA